MRNLIEALNKSDESKPKYQQIVLNIGLQFPHFKTDGDLEELTHLALLKKQRDVIEAMKTLVEFISQIVNEI